MKAISSFGIITVLLVILIGILALTNFSPSLASAPVAGAAGIQQTTPTPPGGDASEIGSTDGILVMGVVITVIIILPLLFRKRNKA
ncbi:hypothetical protein FBQ99_06510 [Chloroflexi bacterium CFX2]|nr:hypothetical protein [Chloroflexi bacterium CFX2]